LMRIRDGKYSVLGRKKFLIRDPGWKNSDPGSGLEKIRIRDNIPDLQHWIQVYLALPAIVSRLLDDLF
jgi:hypothetical protein